MQLGLFSSTAALFTYKRKVKLQQILMGQLCFWVERDLSTGQR